MFVLIDRASELIPGFMLILARVSGLLMTLPIFSSNVISRRVRAYLAIVFALMIAASLSMSIPDTNSMPQLLFLIAVELLVGISIGFGTLVIFEGFNLAGSFMGRQMGFFMARVLDPTTQQQTNIVSPFLIMIVMLYFMVTNTHHIFIQTIFENFRIIPLGMGHFPSSLGRSMIQTGSAAYRLAIQFAGPTMVFLLLLQVATSFSVRVMPQMNVFFIMLPLRIGCGLFALMTSLKIFQLIFDSFYKQIFTYLNGVIFQIKGT